MPTTDKFSKKVVSTTVLNDRTNLENDHLLVKTAEKAGETYSFQQQLLKTDLIKSTETEGGDDFKVEYVWRNIIFFIFMHLTIPYTFYVGIRGWKVNILLWRKFGCWLNHSFILGLILKSSN